MSHRNEDSTVGDHAHMNGHMKRKRKSKFEHLNQSLLFDQLVNRYVVITALWFPLFYATISTKGESCELNQAFGL